MRIPRKKGAIISAIVWGGFALIMLLDPFFLGESAGLCAGFFGLLALWSFADYHATKRREKQRVEELFQLEVDSWRRLETAQGDPAKLAEITKQIQEERSRLMGW